MLLRLGMQSRLETHTTRCNLGVSRGKDYEISYLSIIGFNSKEHFFRYIGFRQKDKQAKYSPRNYKEPCAEVYDISLFKSVQEKYDKGTYGGFIKNFSKSMSRIRNNEKGSFVRQTIDYWRFKLPEFDDAVKEDETLSYLLDNNLLPVKVSSINKLEGDFNVVDICETSDNLFIANGFLTHNSNQHSSFPKLLLYLFNFFDRVPVVNFRCLTSEHIVLHREKGYITVDRVEEGDFIYSGDSFVKVIGVHENNIEIITHVVIEVKVLDKVIVRNIRGLKDHKLFCDRGVVELDDLSLKDIIDYIYLENGVSQGIDKTIFKGNVVSISKERAEHTYAIEVEGHIYWSSGFLSHNCDGLAASIRDDKDSNFVPLIKKLKGMSISMAVEGFGPRIRNLVLNKNLNFDDVSLITHEVCKNSFARLKLGYIHSALENEQDYKEGFAELMDLDDIRASYGTNTNLQINVTQLILHK